MQPTPHNEVMRRVRGALESYRQEEEEKITLEKLSAEIEELRVELKNLVLYVRENIKKKGE